MAGGTYLILFVLGMVISKEQNIIENVGRKSLLGVIFFAIVVPFWGHFIAVDNLALDSKLPFGSGFNPPSISFGLYACLIFGLVYSCSIFINSIKEFNWFSKFIIPITFIGRHTLYIFLYHRLFLDYFNPLVYGASHLFKEMYEKTWFKCAWIFFIMIVGPIIIEAIMNKLKRKIVSVYFMEGGE